MSKRREFSRKVRGEIILRATNADGRLQCERCGTLILKKSDYEIDHCVAEGLVVDKSKPLTAEDGQLLGKQCCHRAPGGKTAQDQARIAKAKAQHDRDIGAFPPTKHPIKSRGFAKAPKPPRPQSKPPRPLYRPGPAHGGER